MKVRTLAIGALAWTTLFSSGAMAAPIRSAPTAVSLKSLVSKPEEVKAAYGSGLRLISHLGLGKGKVLSSLCPHSIYRSAYIVTYEQTRRKVKGLATLGSAAFTYANSNDAACLFKAANALKPVPSPHVKTHISNVSGLGNEAKLVTFAGASSAGRSAVVAFRRGSLEGEVIVSNFNSKPSTAPMITLAKEMDVRMQAAH